MWDVEIIGVFQAPRYYISSGVGFFLLRSYNLTLLLLLLLRLLVLRLLLLLPLLLPLLLLLLRLLRLYFNGPNYCDPLVRSPGKDFWSTSVMNRLAMSNRST